MENEMLRVEVKKTREKGLVMNLSLSDVFPRFWQCLCWVGGEGFQLQHHIFEPRDLGNKKCTYIYIFFFGFHRLKIKI